MSAEGKHSGLFLMGLSALSFSCMVVCIKALVQVHEMPAAQVVFFRGLICVALTLVVLKRQPATRRIERPGLLVLRGAFGFCGLLLYSLALAELPLADTMALQYTHPIFGALLAAACLGERLHRRAPLGLALCALGALIILRPTGEGSAYGNLLGLASGFFSALAYICVRALSRTESTAMIILSFHLACIIGGGLFMLQELTWPDGLQWLLLLGVGVFAQAGQWFLTLGLGREQAGIALAMSYSAIAFGAVWGWAVFGEPLSIAVLLGTGLMVLGLRRLRR